MIGAALLCLAVASLILGGLYAGVTFANLAIFRAPQRREGGARHAVSILIPARDEASNIAEALASVLAQRDVDLEAIVLDDGSSDGTDRIVRDIAATDRRVRLVRGAPLPKGWNGKQHACHQLGLAARNPLLLFLDADVRLAPEAVARMADHLAAKGLDLVSGFPRQITRTLPEIVVIPQILVILLGYLPLGMARKSDEARFAAGCGQLMLVDAEAYRRAGGHEAFRDRMHDGLNLPRNIRHTGGRSDIVDATPLASCRMYDTWSGIWHGFTKNATEGMATRRALPIWTILLAGGHVLPPLVVLLGWIAGAGVARSVALIAAGLVLAARALLAWKVRQHPVSVVLHPIGILVVIWMQWSALAAARNGRQAVWRGRAYDVN